MAVNLVDRTPDVLIGHILSSVVLLAVTLFADRRRRGSRVRLAAVLTLLAPAVALAVHFLIMFVRDDYWVFQTFTIFTAGPPRYYGLLSVVLPCVVPAAVLVGASLLRPSNRQP